jgi:hypothetical protein
MGEQAVGKAATTRTYTKRTKPTLKRAPKPSVRREFGAYSVLGLKFGASELQIRRAWREKALAFHPDKLPPNCTSQQRSANTKKFNEAKNAYDLLANVDTKSAYDMQYFQISTSTIRVREHRARLTAMQRRIVSSMSWMRRLLGAKRYQAALRKVAKKSKGGKRSKVAVIAGKGQVTPVKKVLCRKTPNINNRTCSPTQALVVATVGRNKDKRRNGVVVRPESHFVWSK